MDAPRARPPPNTQSRRRQYRRRRRHTSTPPRLTRPPPVLQTPAADQSQAGAEVDKVELDISAQYTRIYPYSCRGCIFLMYSVNAPAIIMCLNNSPRAGYNVIRLQILCLSFSDSRTRLCATTAFWGRPCDAAGEQDANAGYQLGDIGRTFATKREMCLAHPSRMPGPRRGIVWVSAS